jgi:hypothetical protein
MSAGRRLVLAVALFAFGVPTAESAKSDYRLILEKPGNYCSINEARRRSRRDVIGTFPTAKEACLYAQDWFDASQDDKTKCWEYPDSTRDFCYDQKVFLPEAANPRKPKHHPKKR